MVKRQRLALGDSEALYQAAARRFTEQDGLRRLWARDASLWTNDGEDDWLGWLDLPSATSDPEALRAFAALADQIRREGTQHVVVLGMGGSSLCPDVLARCFGRGEGWPELRILDSTVPDQIQALTTELDLARTVFVVSSKSGGTIEPNSFLAWFYARVAESTSGSPGRHFIAITDPGSSLEAEAARLDFRATLYGVPSVGGRFSALSAFGMLPAALQGLDVGDLLARAQKMASKCGPDSSLSDNPGAQLGVAMGALAAAGRDKLSLVLSPALAPVGGWLEQLIAESTGKGGQGIVPVDGERLLSPAEAGDDRLFVYLRAAFAADPEQDRAVAALDAAGIPLIQIGVEEAQDIVAEFFRWEIATAVAGAVLGVNPFDQPDVEAAKVEARSLMERYEQSGTLPVAAPLLDEVDASAFGDGGLGATTIEELLVAHLGRIGPGDYFAINAYLEMTRVHDDTLQRIRRAVGKRHGIATTLGYGPRFLHSTGQLHKGGPDSGVFLQITTDATHELEIPGQRYDFAVLCQAQALGDFAVLVERGRRALRVHLKGDPLRALEALAERIERASEA